MQDFAVPVPMYVIADQLGVPRSHRDRFKEWSDSAVAPLGLLLSDERKIECAKSAVEMQHYFVEVFADRRSEEHTSELQSLMRISYAVFCLKKKTKEDNTQVET